MTTTWTVYHVGTTIEKCVYKRRAPAKKLAEALGADFAYAPTDVYRSEVVHLVTRVNLMTGKEYQEPSNTPNYLSPASEAYWSM